MANSVIIVGAGRQGRNVIEGLAPELTARHFIDDTKPVGAEINGIKVAGGFSMLETETFGDDVVFLVALGDNAHRKRFAETITAKGGRLTNSIHPTASVSNHARLGSGIYLGAFVRIQANARIEDGVLMEAHSFSGTDSLMGRFSRSGCCCSMLGGVQVGESSFIGSGAVIGEDVSVGDNTIVGANSVITRDAPSGVRLYGAPGRLVEPKVSS